MRRVVFLVASVLVSALFLWLALRDQDLGRVWASIRQADTGWMLAAMVAISLGLWTRGVRWRGLLDDRLTVPQAGHILNIGFLLNLLPLRAGELARSVLATRYRVPFMTAAASVVFERLVDTLLVVIMLVIALSRLPNTSAAITGPTTLFGVAVVAAFAVLVFFSRYPSVGHRAVALVERLLPFLKRLSLGRLLDHALDGLKPLNHGRSAARAIVWTLISWAISLFTLYCLVMALRIDGVDRLMLTVLGLMLAALSIAVPVSVAGIGPFQAALIVAGQAVGLSGTPEKDALALSLGFLFHAVNILGYAVWGTVGMLALGVSLGDVLKRDAPTPREADAPAAD